MLKRHAEFICCDLKIVYCDVNVNNYIMYMTYVPIFLAVANKFYKI